MDMEGGIEEPLKPVDAATEAKVTDLEEDTQRDFTIIILLLLLLLVFVVWVYKRRRPVVKATQLMQSTQDEMNHYRKLFDQVDTNASGHITTTELLQAFRELNVTTEGRGHQISFLDVEKLRKKVDDDKNILIEFSEFVNIFKLERLDFAEKLMKEADAKGMKEADYDSVMEALKKAGFATTNPNWANFVRQHNKNKTDKVDYEQLIEMLEEAVVGH